MLRWALFALAILFVLLGYLTVFRSPDWSPWRLAVLAGEFGHWFVLAAIVVAACAWLGRGHHLAFAAATVTLAALGAALLLKPAFQARRIAATLPDRLKAQFGAPPIARGPFSIPQLFVGRNSPPATIQTVNTGSGLPIDFYRPRANAGRRPVPCVIAIHGGGWDSGDRMQLPALNHWLAHSGYAVAAVSYRLAPKHRWPAQREDLSSAISYLKAHAGELGIDPGRFVLLGRSAGGQLALTVAYTVNDPAIRGVVGLYAPSDLVWGYLNTHENDAIRSPGLMRKFLGGTPDSARANYESASALNHTTKHSPPTLLLHGENDTLASPRHSVRLAARLSELGVAHAFVSLPWAGHGFEYNLQGPGGQLTMFALEWFLAGVTR
jgi:acetyl esterase/lipase